MAKQLVVEVRQEHWDRAKQAVAREESPFVARICVVAQAIKDLVAPGTHVSVCHDYADIGDARYRDGQELQDLVAAFDGYDGASDPEFPVTLTLTEDA